MDQTNLIKDLFTALLLVVLQAFLWNNIHLFGWVSPMCYLIYFYAHPSYTNPMRLLTTAFFMGLLLDIWLDTLALHALACVVVAQSRPWIMQLTFGLAHEQKTFRIHQATWLQRMVFFGLITSIHHLVFFTVEDLSWSHIGAALWRTLITGVATIGVSMLLISVFKPAKS